MTYTLKLWLLAVALGSVAAVFILGAWSTAADCRNAGGVPVRGMTGVECIHQCQQEAAR